MDEKQEIQALRRELEQANYDYYVLDDPKLSDYEFDHKLRRLEELRAGERCFGPDAWVTTWDTGNRQVLALVRRVEGETLTCLFNFSDQFQTVHMDAMEGEFEDLITGERGPCSTRQLWPYQYCLCRRRDGQ